MHLQSELVLTTLRQCLSFSVCILRRFAKFSALQMGQSEPHGGPAGNGRDRSVVLSSTRSQNKWVFIFWSRRKHFLNRKNFVCFGGVRNEWSCLDSAENEYLRMISGLVRDSSCGTPELPHLPHQCFSLPRSSHGHSAAYTQLSHYLDLASY